MWGAAPRPGREKFSLHPRHVCDVPKGDAVDGPSAKTMGGRERSAGVLARKATGVSPSGFARTGVFAESEIRHLHSGPSVARLRALLYLLNLLYGL